MADMPLYSLEHVSKRYKRHSEEVQIFHDLDLTFQEGEFVALMGPSGSGKTTLLNILGGIDRASEGHVFFRDQPLHAFTEAKLSQWRAEHIGFLFQFYHLLPVLTAFENVELPLLLTGLRAKGRRERVETVLELVGLGHRRKHKPSELSGGEQQRVAIARAIVSDPSVLICDEPTGDLDRDSADEVMVMLRTLNREFAKTIILVTHDEAVAARADRILRLNKGRFEPERREALRA